MLDGHDIRNLRLKWLREQMGLVSQEPALFSTSMAGNILYGKKDADMDQIIEAAKAANAHSFVQHLPDGYHTQVGNSAKPFLSNYTTLLNQRFLRWLFSESVFHYTSQEFLWLMVFETYFPELFKKKTPFPGNTKYIFLKSKMPETCFC